MTRSPIETAPRRQHPERISHSALSGFCVCDFLANLLLGLFAAL